MIFSLTFAKRRPQVLIRLRNMALDLCPQFSQELTSQEVMDFSSPVTEMVDGPPWP